eukprot:12204966-Heterocapsa_arctica.AAC.3
MEYNEQDQALEQLIVGKETPTCKDDDEVDYNESERRGTKEQYVNSKETIHQDNYKEQKRTEIKEKEKEKESSGRRYTIEGCRACGRSSETETPASLLGCRRTSFDVRVLD